MPYTFGAEDILNALGITAADFEVQESGSDDQVDTAVVRDRNGGYISTSEVSFNRRIDKTVTIKAKTPDLSGAAISFKIGGPGAGSSGQKIVITQFTLKQSYNSHATLSVTAHQHSDAEDSNSEHLAAQAGVNEWQISGIKLGFGVLVNYLGGSLKDLQSVELTAQVDHVDKLSNRGKFLVGTSYGLKIECTQEYVDNGTPVTVNSPWILDAQSVRSSGGDSPDFYTRTVKAHCYDASAITTP